MLPPYITHYFSGKDYMLKTSATFLLRAAAVITNLKETGKGCGFIQAI